MLENNSYSDSRFKDKFSDMRSEKLLRPRYDKVITLSKKFANFLSNNIFHSTKLFQENIIYYLNGIIKVKLDINHDSLNDNQVKDFLSQDLK